MTVEKREAMQEIAKPILSVEEGKNVEITEENRIVYYEFSIKNFKEESVSDISFWYTIEIISSLKDIEVEYKLEKSEDIKETISKLTDEMLKCATEMEFEKAAELRDKIRELEKLI